MEPSAENSVDSSLNPNDQAHFEQALSIFDKASEAFINCQFQTALLLFEEALSRFNRLSDEKSQRNVGMCLGNIGLVHYQLGSYEQARGYHHKALEISQKLQDKRSEADDWGNLGLVALKQGNFPEAIEFFEKASSLYTELERFDGVGRQFGNLGIVYFLTGHYEKARKYFLDAIRFVSLSEKGDFYSHLGTIQMSLSDYRGAEEYFTKAVQLAREFEDLESEANALGNLGLIYQQLGKYEKAKVSHEEALALSRKIFDKSGEGFDLGHLGVLYQEVGDLQQAALYHQKAIDIARSIGCRYLESSQLLNLGLMYYDMGCASGFFDDIRQALSFTRDGLKIAEAIEAQEQIIIGNFLMGAVLEFFDQEATYRAAYICYLRAIESLERTRAEFVLEQSRIGFAENKVNLYERVVYVAMKLGKTKDAYELAERGKSRALLELLNRSYPSIAHQFDIKPFQDQWLQQTDFRRPTSDRIGSTTASAEEAQSQVDNIGVLDTIWEGLDFSPTEPLTFDETRQCLNPC